MRIGDCDPSSLCVEYDHEQLNYIYDIILYFYHKLEGDSLS